MGAEAMQIVSRHDAGEHHVFVREADGKLYMLCTIPFEKGEIMPLLKLLHNLLVVVEAAAEGKSIDWGDIAGRCKREIQSARHQPKSEKFRFS